MSGIKRYGGTMEQYRAQMASVEIYAHIYMRAASEVGAKVFQDEIIFHDAAQADAFEKRVAELTPANMSTPVRWADVPREQVLRDIEKMQASLISEISELFDADPNCEHDVQPAPFGGGVKCTKCRGWFCF